MLHGGNLNIRLRTSSSTPNNIQLNPDDNVWNHVAVTFDTNTLELKVYVNGNIEYDGLIGDAGWRPSNQAPQIARKFKGWIDEVRVWNRTLSSQEVNASYQAGTYQLFRNFTGLSEDIFNFVAYTIDAAGNINSTETREVGIDNTPPNIDFVSPTGSNGTESENKNYIVWNVSVTEDIGFCKIEINGTNQTGTAVNATADSYCYYNETGLSGNVTRCAYWHATDEAGNWNTTLEYICRNTNEQSLPNTVTINASFDVEAEGPVFQDPTETTMRCGWTGLSIGSTVGIDFNTSEILDSATITQVDFKFYVDISCGSCTIDSDELTGGGSPAGKGAAETYYNASDESGFNSDVSGEDYINEDNAAESTGWKTITLSSQAESDLETQLGNDWFSLGMYHGIDSGVFFINPS
jgi:hypothetical protein